MKDDYSWWVVGVVFWIAVAGHWNSNNDGGEMTAYLSECTKYAKDPSEWRIDAAGNQIRPCSHRDELLTTKAQHRIHFEVSRAAQRVVLARMRNPFEEREDHHVAVELANCTVLDAENWTCGGLRAVDGEVHPSQATADAHPHDVWRGAWSWWLLDYGLVWWGVAAFGLFCLYGIGCGIVEWWTEWRATKPAKGRSL